MQSEVINVGNFGADLPIFDLTNLRNLRIRILDLWENAAYWVPMLIFQAKYSPLETLTLDIWLATTKAQLECACANDICLALEDLLEQATELVNVTIVYRGTIDYRQAEKAILDRFAFCERFPDCDLNVVEGESFYKEPPAAMQRPSWDGVPLLMAV